MNDFCIWTKLLQNIYFSLKVQMVQEKLNFHLSLPIYYLISM